MAQSRLARLAFSGLYVKNRAWNDLRYWLYRRIYAGRTRAVRINGYTLVLDMGDEGISKDLLNIGGREFFSTEYVKTILSGNDVVYDIGANIGYYALLESLYAKYVIALEPVPGTHSRLLENIRANQFRNIEAYPFAMGDRIGEEDMYINDRSNWSAMTEPPYGRTIGMTRVPVVTLDHLVAQTKKPPTFIRMDVEGYEYHVLAGARKTLGEAGTLRLFIEFHPSCPEKFRLIDCLRSRGFEVRKLFLEPEPWNYRDMEALNALGKRFGFPGYGEHEPSYERLSDLLSCGCCPEAFLEKVK